VAKQKYTEQMDTMLGWYTEWQTLLGGKGESANEDARFVLPNAAETKLIVTMNARELMHFFYLRCCDRAQWEIREIAWQMLKECIRVAPNIFVKAGPGCVGAGCQEGQYSCGRPDEYIEKRENLMYT
jgi:thymidylate synthase (FAD)